MFTLDYTTVEQDRVLDLVRKSVPPEELELLDELLLELDKKMELMDVRIDELLRERCNLRDDLIKKSTVMENLRHDITCLEFMLRVEEILND
jgi:hypothetical protein